MEFAAGHQSIDSLKTKMKLNKNLQSFTQISTNSSISSSILSSGDIIQDGSIIANSVLGNRVSIGKRCDIDHCIFLGADEGISSTVLTMTNKISTHVGEDSILNRVILDNNIRIGNSVDIGPNNGTVEEREEILKKIGLKPFRLEDGRIEGDFYIEPQTGILVIGGQDKSEEVILPDGLKC